MTTPTDHLTTTPAPRPPSDLVAGRIGPPVALPRIRRVLADHGYVGPLEVARYVWRFDLVTVTRDVVGWTVIAAHLTPAGWWAHLEVVGQRDDNSDIVMGDVAAELFGEHPSWRVDPVGHRAAPPDSTWGVDLLPNVLHRWGVLEDVDDLVARAGRE